MPRHVRKFHHHGAEMLRCMEPGCKYVRWKIGIVNHSISIFFFRRLKCFVCWAATLAMSTMCSIALTAQTVKMHQWWGSNSIIIFYWYNAEVPLIKWLICRRNFSRHVDVKHSGIFRAEASFLLCQACGSPMHCQCQAEAATLPSPVMKQRLLRFLGWEVVMLADKGRKL